MADDIATIDVYTTGEYTRIGYAGLPQHRSVKTLTGKLLWLKTYHGRLRRNLLGNHCVLVLPTTFAGLPRTTAQVITIYGSKPSYGPVCSLAMMAMARFLVDYPSLLDTSRLTRGDIDALPDPRRYLVLGVGETMMKLLPIMTLGCKVFVKVPVLSNGRSDPNRPVFLVPPPAKVHDHFRVSVPVASYPSLAWLGCGPHFGPGWDQFRGHLAWSRGWYFVLDMNELTDEPGPINAAALLDPNRITHNMVAATVLLVLLRIDRSVQVAIETPDGDPGYLQGLVIAAPYSPSPDTFIVLCITADGAVGRGDECDGIIAREAALYQTRAHRQQHPMPRTTYYTPTSMRHGSKGALVAEVDERFGRGRGRNIDLGNVRVKVEGWPSYNFPS